MSESEMLSIAEFRMLTGLSAEEVLQLLATAQLSFSSDENGCLRIDPSSFTPSEAFSVKDAAPIFQNDRGLLEEILASSVIQALDDMVDEAVELALTWPAREARDPLPTEAPVSKPEEFAEEKKKTSVE